MNPAFEFVLRRKNPDLTDEELNEMAEKHWKDSAPQVKNSGLKENEINPDLSCPYKVEIAEKAMEEIKKLTEYSKRISDEAEFIREDYEERKDFFENHPDYFLEELYDFFNSAHPKIRDFITSFLKLSDYNFEAFPGCGTDSHNIFQDEISAIFEKEYVLLSLPILSNRQAKNKNRKRNSEEISDSYYYSIVNKLDDELEKMGNGKYDYCNHFYEKNICYLFNTGLGPLSADVDNLETGSVTDAIGVVFGGDSSFTTSFSLMPINEEEIENKTFVVITKGKNEVLAEEKYLEILKKHFSIHRKNSNFLNDKKTQ